MIQKNSSSPVATHVNPVFSLRIQFLILALLITVLLSSTARSQILMQDLGHLAFENAEVKISLSSDNTGTIIARCIDCDLVENTITLKIDKNSQALINNQLVSFSQAQNVSGGIQAVIYEPEAMRLVKLHIVTNL